MTEEMDRRDFLKLNLKSSFRFLAEIVGPQIKKERGFIRPPGSAEEVAFLSLCTRCGACASACPTQTIRLFEPTKGTVQMNTPYMNLNESPCSFCEACIEVCPTDALKRTDEIQTLGTAKVLQNICVAYNQVMCDYCVRSCPTVGALIMEDGKPVVNEQVCTGCGYCVSACIHEPKALCIENNRER